MGAPEIPPAPPAPPPPPDASSIAVRQAQDARRRKAMATMGRMSSYLKGPQPLVTPVATAPKSTLGS